MQDRPDVHPRPSKERIAVIGAGRAGSALAVSLAGAGWNVLAVASTSARASRALAARCLGASPQVDAVLATTDAWRASEEADVVLIAVPDRRITSVARNIAISPKRKIALHTSGSQPASVLAPLQLLDWQVGSLHPLMTFARPPAAPPAFDGVAFAIDGDPKAQAIAKRLARSLGGIPISIPDRHRVRYHLAACLASNYFVTLMAEAVAQLTACGVSERVALAALLPLTRETLENISMAPGSRSRFSALKALTGPVARGDDATIARHVGVLSEKIRGKTSGTRSRSRLGQGRSDAIDLAALHSALVRRTTKLARDARIIDSKAVARIERALMNPEK